MRPGFRFPIWLVIGLASAMMLLGEIAPRQMALARTLTLAAQARARGRPDSAAALTRAALDLSPWRADLWEQAGLDELAAGRRVEAGVALREAKRRGGLTMAGRMALGDVLLGEGDRESALETWQAVVDEGGAGGDAYERICAARRAAGDLDGALRTALDWQSVEPGSAAANYQAGMLRLVLQQEGAIPALLGAANADPGYTGRVEAARRGYGQAMVAEQPARRLLLLGRALGSAGEWDLARVLFAQATQAEPGYAEAWAFLGEARQRLGEDGSVEIARALALDPESLAARGFMAVQLRRQGRYEQAMVTLEKIIAQNPGESMWWIEAGATMADAGDLMTALEYYQHAIELEPKVTGVWQSLARFSIQYEVDIEGTGLPAARRGLELAARDPVGLDLMGWAFLKLGDLASAERFLQRALAEDGRYAAAHLHLGQVYLQLERGESALGHLEMAARLDGEGAVGRLAERLLER